MNKKFLILDEREMRVFLKICTTMYIITIVSLIGIVSYREFVLKQPHQQWDDIAMLMTINVLVIIGAFLYLSGSINPAKIKIPYILIGYIGFVILGFAFTMFKYSVFDGVDINLAFAFDKMKTVLMVSGAIALSWIVLAYFGSKRLENRIK